MLDLAIAHVQERRQFGRPLADLEVVQEKLGWMVSYLFGLESMCYLTTGLVDAGVKDYSLESAMIKISGTEFLWYQANRALQLAGGEGYMRDKPYEKVLRDIRIFPIFEGANDVLRSYVALTGMKPVGDKLSSLGSIGLGDPIGSMGVLVDYVGGRFRSDRITLAHPELQKHANEVGDQVSRLKSISEKLLKEHRKDIVNQGLKHRRISDAVSDIYAQVAVISRVTSLFGEQGLEVSGQERFIAESFCERAARRVKSALDQVERNDDERMTAIAKLAYKRGSYGYSIAE
jgi:acyl-CoA dehydrogenase family protein 9